MDLSSITRYLSLDHVGESCAAEAPLLLADIVNLFEFG